jgi:hypothetical protein
MTVEGFGSILLGVGLLAWAALWVWTLYDAGSYSDDVWRSVGESKPIWFLAILVLQFFGTLVYLVSVRPRLRLAAGQ